MKLSQKTKYICYGVVGAVALIPLAIKAAETIPLTFREGDVISANVINTLLSRVNDVQKGFTSRNELDGSWVCTTYDATNLYNPPGDCNLDGDLTYSKTSTLTFSSTAKTYSGTANVFFCGPDNTRQSGDYDVKGGFLITRGSTGVVEFRNLKRISTSKLQFSGSGAVFVVCDKANTAPNPVNNLIVTASGNSLALTWVDQSTDEIGFKVQRKITSAGAWTDVNTTVANATSFTDSGLSAGTYWYRVLATNANGDSISSSEVQATIQ